MVEPIHLQKKIWGQHIHHFAIFYRYNWTNISNIPPRKERYITNFILFIFGWVIHQNESTMRILHHAGFTVNVGGSGALHLILGSGGGILGSVVFFPTRIVRWFQTSLSQWTVKKKVWTLFSLHIYVIPTSLKFSHWPSKKHKSWNMIKKSSHEPGMSFFQKGGSLRSVKISVTYKVGPKKYQLKVGWFNSISVYPTANNVIISKTNIKNMY